MSAKRDRVILLVILGSAFFFLIAFLAMIYGISQTAGSFAIAPFGGRVAVVDVKGVIESSEEITRQLRKYEDDSSVKAVIVRIDSPGGAVAASHEIYDQLLKFKESGKHVVVSMGSVAASGGYYVACAADTILTNPSTLTGSIGVILSYPVFGKLMDKVGIEMEVLKSGELKDVGDPSRRMTHKEREMFQAVIDDSYEQFVEIVAERRSLEIDYVRRLADGSVFTGRQAVEKGLVDRVGTLQDAIAVAGRMADLGEDPPVVKERLYRRPWWDILAQLLRINLSIADNLRPWPSLEFRYTG